MRQGRQSVIGIVRTRFTPHTDIRIEFLDPFHKIGIIICLITPHSVLDIPVQYSQLTFFTHTSVINTNIVYIHRMISRSSSSSFNDKRHPIGSILHLQRYFLPIFRVLRIRYNLKSIPIDYYCRSCHLIGLGIKSTIQWYSINEHLTNKTTIYQLDSNIIIESSRKGYIKGDTYIA